MKNSHIKYEALPSELVAALVTGDGEQDYEIWDVKLIAPGIVSYFFNDDDLRIYSEEELVEYGVKRVIFKALHEVSIKENNNVEDDE